MEQTFLEKSQKEYSRLKRMKGDFKSGKTKCDALIKRNVIFSCKTKCNKMEMHTIPKGWFEPNIQTDLFLYIEFKLHILISVK